MWPQLWMEVPAWWKDECHGTPLLRLMTPWIFNYFNSWIHAFLANEAAMHRMWWIEIQEFTMLTAAAFIQAAELGIESHATYDTVVSADQMYGRGILLEILERISLCF